jgi:hypothetical protein
MPDTHYVFFGYPQSKNKKFRMICRNYRSYGYFNYGLEESRYAEIGYDKNVNILIKIDKEDSINKEGERMVFPDPVGMSGGGIWKIMGNDEMYKESITPYFVGTVIERSSGDKFLVGTKSKFLFKGIEKF